MKTTQRRTKIHRRNQQSKEGRRR